MTLQLTNLTSEKLLTSVLVNSSNTVQSTIERAERVLKEKSEGIDRLLQPLFSEMRELQSSLKTQEVQNSELMAQEQVEKEGLLERIANINLAIIEAKSEADQIESECDRLQLTCQYLEGKLAYLKANEIRIYRRSRGV